MSGLRDRLKTVVYGSGLWPALHNYRNAQTLTVVMFHRVLPVDAQSTADPGYTVSDTFFAGCLRFFRRHYHVVSLDAVLAARTIPLPANALLITFDDGWADNLTTALPLLRRKGLPAVVFATTDAVTDPAPVWWQDQLIAVLRRGHGDKLGRALGTEPEPLPQLLLRLSAMPPDVRDRLLAQFTPTHEGRQMLDPEGLRRLTEAEIAIGAHGASHLPLPLLANPGADLDRARHSLATLLPDHKPALAALSLPHGRYDAATIAAARKSGFQLVFTSDPCLNATDHGLLQSTVLGRIEMQDALLADRHGYPCPAKLASWLFARPIT
ncbi:MAG: polysaccharide deacetylase family protein [Rhodospirillaceae bacterium]|nr:polysaccharide deacetylase family protein [Rhodospirillales bacterium]